MRQAKYIFRLMIDFSFEPGTQAQRVYQRLRTEILTCRHPPGAKLNIAALAKDHAVSLGGAREGLAMLEKEGLVRFEAQKGYAVSPVSSADLHDLTLARVEIETACLTLSIERGDVEWESQLVASFHRTCRLDRSKEGVFAHSDAAWVSAHERFHAALVAACPSQRLLATRSMLYDHSERYRRLSVTFSVERDVEAEHRQLLQAALDRNIARARSLVQAHIKATAEALTSASF
jgi:DNA-binding GntR family transcriptional regulator